MWADPMPCFGHADSECRAHADLDRCGRLEPWAAKNPAMTAGLDMPNQQGSAARPTQQDAQHLLRIFPEPGPVHGCNNHEDQYYASDEQNPAEGSVCQAQRAYRRDGCRDPGFHPSVPRGRADVTVFTAAPYSL